MQRRIFEASRPRPAGWEHAAAHAVRVLDLYDAARSDTSAFEELLWNLQVDPVTGHGEHTRQADIATRPGIRLLPPGWEGQLGEAAWNYLHQRTPPGPDLLDRPGRLPWPAEAGYLALAHLVLHEAPGRTLAALDGRMLARWAAPILAYPEYHDAKDDGQAKPVLLARLAQVAPDDLPALISKLAAGHLASGSWPAGLEALDAVCTDPVGDVLAGHLRAVTDAMAAALASHAVQPDQHRLDQPAGRAAVHHHHPGQDPYPLRPRSRDRGGPRHHRRCHRPRRRRGARPGSTSCRRRPGDRRGGGTGTRSPASCPAPPACCRQCSGTSPVTGRRGSRRT